MKIRKAKLTDGRTIAAFNLALASETEGRRLDAPTVGRGVNALLKDSQKGIYFVAESDGQIVGQLLITYEWSDWRNGNFWWIQSVYVLPQFRGRGIFRSLSGHVKKLAKSRKGVCGLRLYMHEQNRTAAKAYGKIGMVRAGYTVFEMEFSGKKSGG